MMIRKDVALAYKDRNDISYYLPEKIMAKIPVVILSPGYGGTKELEGTDYALCKELTKLSIAFVAFSPFSFGETKGDDKDFSYGRWSDNLEDVCRWVMQQEWADVNRIGCYAVSSGTTAAIRYAQRSNDLKFIVSVATSLSLHVGMNDSPILKYLRIKLANSDEKFPDYFGKKVSETFYVDSIIGNPIFKIGDIKCPVFYLQGKKDNIWRRTDALIGYEIMKENGQQTKYVEIENGDHLLYETPDDCIKETVNWLKEIQII